MKNKKYLEHQYLTLKKSQKEIAKQCNVSQGAVSLWMKEFNIPTRKEVNTLKDLTGQIHGKLTVIKLDSIDTKKGKTDWLCQCECGKFIIVERRKLNIKRGGRISCGCSSRVSSRRGCGKITGSFWCVIKSMAKSRGYEFSISIEFANKLFEEQKGLCALTGIKLIMPKYTSKRGFDRKNSNASLDRIDSTKGYTEDNVQWVHKKINMMKQGYTQQEFIELCCLVYQNTKEKQT